MLRVSEAHAEIAALKLVESRAKEEVLEKIKSAKMITAEAIAAKQAANAAVKDALDIHKQADEQQHKVDEAKAANKAAQAKLAADKAAGAVDEKLIAEVEHIHADDGIAEGTEGVVESRLRSSSLYGSNRDVFPMRLSMVEDGMTRTSGSEGGITSGMPTPP